MSYLVFLSDIIIPLTAFSIIVYGVLQGVSVYDAFLEGAKEGLLAVWQILPALIGLLTAVALLRAGGVTEALADLLSPVCQLLHFPSELLPLALVRLVSSSAAIGILTDIFSVFGPDSFLGRCASVMMCSTETVFYTMSVYFLSVGIKNSRHTLLCALCANLCGIAASCWLVAAVFGK